jgi:hypothetical protein
LQPAKQCLDGSHVAHPAGNVASGGSAAAKRRVPAAKESIKLFIKDGFHWESD